MGISKKELSLIREIVPNKGMGTTRARAREATFKAPSPSFEVVYRVSTKRLQMSPNVYKCLHAKLKDCAW